MENERLHRELLEGDGRKVASMTKAFQKGEHLKSVKVVVL